MKILYIIILAFLSPFCTSSTQNRAAELISQPARDNPDAPGQRSGSSKWTNNFLELKKAISTGDRSAVKSFIDFPIRNKGNEIWYLADSRLVMEINPEEIRPFTEADFDRYFSSVFALDLRRTLETLNDEEFFKTYKTTSPEIEVVKNSKSRVEASYDSSEHRITLALVTTISKPAKTQFTIHYLFDVLSDQIIKFREVRVE